MYQVKNYDSLLGLPGFSDQALNTHFALYKGYVDNTNKFLEALKQSETQDYAGFKRRLGWEFNGMRLHEYYFEALAKDPKPLNENSELAKKIIADFGSIENWQKDFKATALMRGIGWAILYYDPIADKLINFWIEQHHSGHPAGLKLLLNLDLFEHAFLIDYGTKKADYIETFMKVIDWKKVEERFTA
ncbi:Fe-Mn family superoxide dismutase [Candidatus Parcubacteria bacterium]|nr:Fe-Mn family superoxide dismutase [Patescibacteria group bacterium]MCG2688742.1 Fe-Mn family superoxide dismutase [Candidatus Parcubacteria bacterium]